MTLHQYVILAWGWRRYAIAFCAGLLAAFAQAPFNFFPLIIITMTVSIWLIDGSSHRAQWQLKSSQRYNFMPAVWAGWWLGFGYFVCGLWWLGNPILIEGGDLLWTLPLAILGLPAGLAIFIGLAFGMARLFWADGSRRIIIFALSLSASEWLRGHIFTGFPWNNFGMAFADHLIFAQTASVIGIYGLTFITILVASAPATLWDRSISGRRIKLPIYLSIAAVILMAAFGIFRLSFYPSEFDHDVRLRIMQPNILNDQFRSDRSNDILNLYFKLSDQHNDKNERTLDTRTHLIWPESAFPFILAREPRALARINAFLPPHVTLLTGAARAQSTLNRELIGDSKTEYFNSIQAIADGEIKASVDKFHLVPFGEYLPFRSVLEAIGLRHLVHIPGGFEAGDQQHILNVPGLRNIAPLICYEAIFSGDVVPQGDVRPSVLLNVTNDSWFGFTPGPYQHFAQARLRAIEEGLPLIRDANTGISGVIDPLGRIIVSMPLGEEGAIDSDLPKPLHWTLFSLFGQKIFFVMWFVAGLFTFLRNQQIDQT
jgi:apolipoprotein N-acyltransferase